MARRCESQRDNVPTEPGAALRWYADFFRRLQRDEGMTQKELFELYFGGRLAMGTVKDYLNGKYPDRPQPETLEELKAAWKQASAERSGEHMLYKAVEMALGRKGVADRVLEDYGGLYRFWRHGRHGLVSGTVEIKRHCKAGVPVHVHEHKQAIDAAGTDVRTFNYEGGAHRLARNLCFLSIRHGEIRFCLFPTVPDPRREPMVGMYLSEECDGNRNPFSGKMLLVHEDWYAENQHQLTDRWIRQQLKNGGPPDLMRM